MISEQGETGSKTTSPENISSVLFVCTMNCIRSPMAEELVKKLYPGKLYCDSAGATTGEPDGFAIAVMNERGIDIAGHQPKALEDLEDNYFDLVVTLSPQAHHRAMDFVAGSSAEVEYWPTLDPSTIAGSREEVLQAYRNLRDELEKKIRERFG